MKRYWNLYKAFLRFSFHYFVAYRAYFINSSIATLGWGGFQIIWIHLLTVRTHTAFGWSKNELIILAILYVITIGFLHLFFSHNFDRLARIIDKGELDFILLKPVDSQFMVTVFSQRYSNFIRVVLGIVFLIYFISANHIVIPLAGWIGFACLIGFGVVLLYSLWLTYSSLLIWFPRLNNLIGFLYTINGMSRYPVEMIKRAHVIILIFILPFSMAVATPAKVLVKGAFDGDVAGLVILSIIMFVISRKWWFFALRHYTSTGS